MKVSPSLVLKILNNNLAGGTNKNRAGNSSKISNQGSNPAQANKRNHAAKNKSNAKIMDLKRYPPKDGENQTDVFSPKNHKVFKKDKTHHWCPHQIMWCVHMAAKCVKDKVQEVKQKDAKKKRGH